MAEVEGGGRGRLPPCMVHTRLSIPSSRHQLPGLHDVRAAYCRCAVHRVSQSAILNVGRIHEGSILRDPNHNVGDPGSARRYLDGRRMPQEPVGMR